MRRANFVGTKFGGDGKRWRAKIPSPQPPSFLPACWKLPAIFSDGGGASNWAVGGVSLLSVIICTLQNPLVYYTRISQKFEYERVPVNVPAVSVHRRFSVTILAVF